MRIGIVHEKFTNVGGAELLILRHAAYLRDQGHAVRLVTAELDPARWPRLATEFDTHLVSKRWTDHVGLPGSHPKLARRVRRQAAALRDLDVVVASGFPGNVVAARVSATTPTLWYCNEPYRYLHQGAAMPHLAARVAATRPEDDTAILGHARRLFEQHARAVAAGGMIPTYRAVDVAAVAEVGSVAANSGFAASLVRSVYGRDAVTVYPPTVPKGEAPRRSAGVDRAGLRVLVHSRLETLKNIETVLLGFAAFRARHPGAHELHVVGTGPDESRLRDIARERGIEPVTHFHGFLSERALADVYARCEVMTLLPPDEPFGMVYAEAALQGLLLVGPDHGGPVEILDSGRLGWTVDIFSPEPLAEALAEAWRLPHAEVSRLREQGAAASRERFGPGATLPKLHALVVRAAGSRGR